MIGQIARAAGSAAFGHEGQLGVRKSAVAWITPMQPRLRTHKRNSPAPRDVIQTPKCGSLRCLTITSGFPKLRSPA
jgi:hypothetical protein